MNENRRPPTLHRTPVSDATTHAIVFTLTDKRQVAITPPRETAREEFDKLTASINNGQTITLNDPSGAQTLINSAHIVTMELR